MYREGKAAGVASENGVAIEQEQEDKETDEPGDDGSQQKG
jgi:hypothetical protein